MTEASASGRLATAVDSANNSFSDYPTLDGGCVECGCEVVMQYHYADGRGVPKAPFELTDSNGKVLTGNTSQEGVFKATNIGCGTYEVLFDEGEDEFEPEETYANNPTLQANPEYAALATEYFTLYHHLHQKGLASVSSGGWTDWGDEDMSHDIESATGWFGGLKDGMTQEDANAIARFRELSEQIEDDNGPLEAAIIKTHHQFAGEAADSNMAIMMVAEIILGCIPVVGQVMDVKDCAVWVYDGCVEANGADFSDPLYLGMGALAFIGFVPGLGDAIKKGCTPILKFLRKADDISGVMRKIRKLSNGNLIKWLGKIKGEIGKYADGAIKLAANIAAAFSRLVAKVKRWVPQWLLDILVKLDGYIKKLEQWITDAVADIKRWIDDFIGKVFTKKTGTPQKKNNSKLNRQDAGAEGDVNTRQGKGDGKGANDKSDNSVSCCAKSAAPIRIATGQVIDDSVDLFVSGLPALRLSRIHHLSAYGGLLGKHWHSNLDIHLRVEDDSFYYIDEDYSEVQFYDPNPGEQSRNSQHPQERLCRDEDKQLYILNSAGDRYYFSYALSNRLLLSAIVDANGNRIDIERRVSDGFIVALRRNDGHSLFFSGEIGPQEHNLRLSAVRHRLDNGTASKLLFYRYDEQQRLNHIDGQIIEGWTRYQYNEQGQITRRSDEQSFKAYQYNDQGRVIAQDGSDHHNKTRYAYQQGKTIIDTPSGGQQTYYYDKDGHTTHYTNSIGAGYQLHWQNGQHLGGADPLGRQTSKQLDDWGEVISVTETDGQTETITETIERDDHGRPLSISDASGQQWQYAYDERGNLTTITDPLGQCQHISINEQGLPTEITLPSGGTLRYTYNRHRQLASQTDPNGHSQHYFYDSIGRLQQHTDAEGHSQHWHYEANSHRPQPSRYTDQQGQQWHSHYNEQGQLTGYTDANGHSQRYDYGAFGTLSTQTDASGNSYHFNYGPNSRLERITNPVGEVWQNHYDSEDRVVKTQDFGGSITHYSYDIVGRMVQRHTPDGLRHDYQYDNDDHLIQATTHLRDGSTEQSHYRYEAGRLIQASNAHATVELDYDELGRISAETINGHRVERDYNAAGLCEQVRSPHYQQQRSYNSAYQLQSLALGEFDPLQFHYNARGQETKRHSAQGFGLQQSYSPRGELQHQHAGIELTDPSQVLQHAFKVDRHYGYDSAGQLSHSRDSRWGNSDYRYQANGYIEAFIQRDNSNGLQQEHFNYTPNGDIDSTLSPPVERAQAAAGMGTQGQQGSNIVDLDQYRQKRGYTKGGRVEKIGNTSYRYNDSGQRIEKTEQRQGFRPQTWRYRWDSQGQLSQVHTPSGKTWQYHYDPFGRRIGKIQKAAANDPLASADQIVGEYYHWHNQQLIQTIPQYADGTLAYNDATTYHYHEDSLSPIAQEQYGQLHYLVTDQVGTPREVLNEQGDVLWRANYSLWGELTQQYSEHNENNQQTPDGKSRATKLRFMGQFYDAESGLHYNRHRYYDPETAQYLSSDPIGLAGGLTPQAYVHNPTGWVDPLGLAPLSGVDFSGSDSLYQGGANTVKIQLQGSRYGDFKVANEAAGYKSSAGNFTGSSHPSGYTWHHVDDYDPATNTSTMQLVDTKAHEATYPHKGSVSQFEQHHGVKYRTQEAKDKAKSCNCP